jgi:hypothetical protein
LSSTSRSILVESMTLDAFCNERDLHPQWLVIDVEGEEIAVLKGAHKLLQSRQRTIGVIVEFHPDLWKEAGWSAAELRQLLVECGREIRPLSGQCDPFSEYGQVALEVK